MDIDSLPSLPQKSQKKETTILVANKIRMWLQSETTNYVENLPNAVKSGPK